MKPSVKSAKDPTKKRNTADKKLAESEKLLKCLKIVILAVVILVLCFAPYFRGLYFEAEFLQAEIFTFIAFVLFWAYKFLKKDREFLATPIDYASFGFILVYLISLLGAVSMRLAVLEWLKYCMFFAIFLMLVELVNSYKSKIFVLFTIIATAAGISVLGIDGAAGGSIARGINGIFNAFYQFRGEPVHDTIFQTFLDGRIYSTLQYPNALASYILAVFFITLGLMAVSERLWVRALGAAVNLVLLVTFIFTLSRGVYVLAPIAAVIFLIALPKGGRIKGVMYALASLIPAAASAIILSPLMTGVAENAAAIWQTVLAGAAMAAVLAVVFGYLAKWLERLSGRVIVVAAGLIVIIAAAGAIYILNAHSPLELAHTAIQPDGAVIVRRSAILKPGKEYVLSYRVDAHKPADKRDAYTVQVSYRSEKDILIEKDVAITFFSGEATQGAETREITFKNPADSKVVYIEFINTYQNTGATFDEVQIIEVSTGKVVDDIALKYKYLPESIVSRFQDIQAAKSNIERGYFYRDGFGIMKDHFFIGAGGGAWSMLNFSYQSYLYWSSQAHNYFLQLGIEAGVIGLIVLLALILSILALFFAGYRVKNEGPQNDRIIQGALVTALIILLAHSFIDFDFSITAVFLLFWEILAVFTLYYRNTDTGAMEEKQGFFLKLNAWRRIPALKLHPVIGLVMAGIFLVFSVMLVSASGYGQKGSQLMQSSPEQALRYMEKAVDMDPFNASYQLYYANLLKTKKSATAADRQKADELAGKAEDLSKYDFSYYSSTGKAYLLPTILQYHFSTGEIDKGLAAANRMTELKPLVPTTWQDRIKAHYEVMKFYFFQQQNLESALEYADKTLAMIDEAKEVNKKNILPFIFNWTTLDTLEKTQYMSDSLKAQKFVNPEMLVFYNMPDMDIDADGIPDQWEQNINPAVKFTSENGIMTVENTIPDQPGVIQSRMLGLRPGIVYEIEVELADSAGISSIPIAFTGLSSQPGILSPDGNAYRAELVIPADLKAENNVMQIGIAEKLKIKDIRMIQKEG